VDRVTRVAVAGALGKLGSVARSAFSDASEFEYVGGFARSADPAGHTLDSLDELLELAPDVLFDALTMPASFDATMKAVARGVRPVIGTSGWSAEQLTALANELEKRDLGGAIVPNFSLGAALMMRFAEEASQFFPGVEIIEMHRATKKDKPSGTAAATAARIAARRGGAEPAIHSVRLPGLLAHQEVLFGGTGELLTIRHDSLSYESFVPGMLVAAKAVRNLKGLAVGLEAVLKLVSVK
jgi:4-hydroxy-tetrahydrodipicolinate reductase